MHLGRWGAKEPTKIRLKAFALLFILAAVSTYEAGCAGVTAARSTLTSSTNSGASVTPGGGGTGGGGGGGTGSNIPSGLGWYQIPNTQMQSVCPPNNYNGSGYAFNDNCHNVVDAWGGGVADTAHNRLIVWGGGHSDYSGNELYDLDLNTMSVNRLTDPALPISSGCTEALTGPTPNSRHTYDDLTYVPDTNVLLSFTGALAPTGCSSKALWQLDMSTLTWTQLSPSGTPPVYQGGVGLVAYDPNTKQVFVSTDSYGSFASYDPSTNSYTLLNAGDTTDYHETSVIDPGRKLFLIFGDGAWKIDISGSDPSYSLHTLNASGCNFTSTAYPGVAYDSVQKLIVGWAGGNSVDLYNPDTDSCTSVSYPNGPGAAQANGTYKRFSYFPALNVFALINSFSENAYTLRLTPGTGTAAYADFQARCAAPGVLNCVGWDSPSDFTPASGGGGYASGLYPASDGTIRAVMDTANMTSGVGSLLFNIPSGATKPLDANAAGYWLQQFGTDGSAHVFGEGSTLYIQFRLRLSPEMLNFDWTTVSGEGWKVFIVWGPIPGPSCTGDQFVQENTFQTNVATGYTSCSAPALYNTSVTPVLIEQGDFNCQHGILTSATCFFYQPNTWMTFYWKVQIGTYGQPNTQFSAWAGLPGQPLKQFINLPNFTFGDPADHSLGLMGLQLTPYFSGSIGATTSPAATMAFDELIISTQPIAAPAN